MDRGNVVFLHKLPKVVHGGQEYNAGVTEYRKKRCHGVPVLNSRLSGTSVCKNRGSNVNVT